MKTPSRLLALTVAASTLIPVSAFAQKEEPEKPAPTRIRRPIVDEEKPAPTERPAEKPGNEAKPREEDKPKEEAKPREDAKPWEEAKPRGEAKPREEEAPRPRRRTRGTGNLSSARETPDTARQIRVAVLDLYERTPYGDTPGSLGSSTSQSLRDELSKTGRYEVKSADELDEVLTDARVENGALINTPAAIRLGKMADVDYVVYGDIEKLQVERSKKDDTVEARVTVNYRVMGIQGGRLWREDRFTASSTGGRGDDPKTVTDRALQRTVDQFLRAPLPEPLGKVALIDTETQQFVINLGAANGIEKGAAVEVVRWGKDIVDPDSGKVIDREKSILCWGRVVSVSERSCRLEAGEFSRSDFGQVKWRSRKQKLDEIRVGDTVYVVDGRKAAR